MGAAESGVVTSIVRYDPISTSIDDPVFASSRVFPNPSPLEASVSNPVR